MINRNALREVECFTADDAAEIAIDAGVQIETPVLIVRRETRLMGNAHIGAFSAISGWLFDAVESIGRYSTISWGVHFGTFEHPSDRITTSGITYHGGYFGQGSAEPIAPQRPIIIENDVFIGEHAYIKSGVTLHTGCIVGCHAVVTKDVPPYAIVVGNPGRIVRYRFEPAMIERLLKSEWWRYDLRQIGAPLSKVEQVLDIVESGALQPYTGRIMSGAELCVLAETPVLRAAE